MKQKNAGVDKMIVNHPDSSMMGPIPPEKQVEMDREGAYSNLLINAGWFGFDSFDIVAQVKKIGTEHFMISRDVGQSCNANPIGEPTSHVKLFAFCLLDPKSIETITKQNPAVY